MRTVGLHFGHDASGAVVGAEGLRLFLDKERRCRVKRALGLSSADLRELLADAPEDTPIGFASTQLIPICHEPDVEIAIDESLSLRGDEFFKQIGPHYYRRLTAWNPGFESQAGRLVQEGRFGHRTRLNEGAHRSFEALAMVAGQFETVVGAMRRSGTLKIDGRTYRGWYYQHHFLHALYAGWTASPDRPALVITQDGGDGPSFQGGGIYFWRPDKGLLPVTPVDGWVGRFYDRVAVAVGFDEAGGAGKLMGLAPYGRPIYFDEALVGTRWQVSDGYRLSKHDIVSRWLERFGLAREDIPTWDAFTERPPALVADIAASAQLVVERNVLGLARAAVSVARHAAFEFDSIILCGGVALNCPANSNLAVTLDKPVLAPPAVNDEGLSIGAAVAAWFDTHGRYPAGPRNYAEAAYIGTDVDEAGVTAAAAAHGWRRVDGDDLAATARLLLDDAPVGLCVGRSEAGPRALGHRSILANPASPSAWAATNRLKRREPWRPFAPAILLERSADHFDRGPAESRFMLFTYRTNGKALPAVTHYDHSSRVQHVSPETGRLYDLLKTLEAMGAPPVVLNTSFNGPGTPIVDTAEDAFREAGVLGLDHILTDYGLFART